MNNSELDQMFAEAKAERAKAVGDISSDDLMARILADGIAMMPQAPKVGRAGALSNALSHAQSRGLRCWQAFSLHLRGGLGTAAVAAGVSAVGLTGLWYGYNDPSGMSDMYMAEHLLLASDAGIGQMQAAEYLLIEG